MAERNEFDKIELHLVRVLHTLITERSVSRAAMKLDLSQPAVSAHLRRLRQVTGDVLLVRSGNGMAPTPVALELAEPAAELLQQADRLFGRRQRSRSFEPANSEQAFRVAASDYLDPLFLPQLVTTLKRAAPGVRLDLLPLSGEFDVQRRLSGGDVDLVVGNWLEPPEDLHLGRLLTDEVVCLVAHDHPAVRNPRAWTVEKYLASEHVAPTPLHTGRGARGVIDAHLEAQGLVRQVTVRSAHFGQIPQMVAGSLLVLTTGRQFCQRYVDQLPVKAVRCPVAFPPMSYYQLWHDRTHPSAAHRWLREQVRDVARNLVARKETTR
ncbi:LysR family transcriptional regulator [Schlegelella sp. S2-27]|uniref:LysR family transcriptional regulator n=1 Tax=Caldimonas mangrovi TaxID=2944811 RepID=A0ABT0YVZ6_9BURK|nr:LysR family transcriptional regulator [Caldimonas mangrovi]MCM5682574.1 LysR family transcriptional regulator [Caldimonas mangrovi]